MIGTREQRLRRAKGRVGLINMEEAFAPGDYVILTNDAWKSVLGELMARPDLFHHIGPIRTWTLKIHEDAENDGDDLDG